jgi:hypothetical protein
MLGVVAILSSIASAQNPPSQVISETLVLPVPAAALSVETVEERTTQLPDGTSKTGVKIGKVFRDASGRMRVETSIDGPSGDSTAMVQIVDGVAGFMAILMPQQQMAGRFEFPKQDLAHIGFGFTSGPPLRNQGKMTRKTEGLGKQTIEGIEFEGQRTTYTWDDQPSVVATEDRWSAKELGLFGLVKYSGPDRQTTTKIRNLVRSAPDPGVFKIPSDYFVQDLKDDQQQQ